MINKSSVRKKNREKFEKSIELRKLGLSYSEIRRVIPIAKSTLNNWLTLAGLTISKQHLEIQLRKRLENHQAATEASRITRRKKREENIKVFIKSNQKFLTQPLFITGVMLYKAEGSKNGSCSFSNSDHKLIRVFLKFLEKYLLLNIKGDIDYRLYIHQTRKEDLKRIIDFWSQNLEVPSHIIKITWKKNKIIKRRANSDYVGQMVVRTRKISYATRKLLAVSDIILEQDLRS